MAEDSLRRIPSTDWAKIIRKVLRGRPARLPECGGTKVVAFITDYEAVGRIIGHLKPTFIAEKPPAHIFTEVAPMAAEGSSEYFS